MSASELFSSADSRSTNTDYSGLEKLSASNQPVIFSEKSFWLLLPFRKSSSQASFSAAKPHLKLKEAVKE